MTESKDPEAKKEKKILTLSDISDDIKAFADVGEIFLRVSSSEAFYLEFNEASNELSIGCRGYMNNTYDGEGSEVMCECGKEGMYYPADVLEHLETCELFKKFIAERKKEREEKRDKMKKFRVHIDSIFKADAENEEDAKRIIREKLREFGANDMEIDTIE